MDRLEYASDYVRGVAVYWLPTWLLTGASWAATAWSHTPLDVYYLDTSNNLKRIT